MGDLAPAVLPLIAPTKCNSRSQAEWHVSEGSPRLQVRINLKGVGRVALWVKALVTRSEGLQPVPGTHMVELEH